MEFVGRKKELVVLKQVEVSKKAEFVAVYGRRRVGKTYLIRHAFNNGFHFAMTGLANASLSQQLINFNYAANTYWQDSILPVPANWQEAFHQLINILTPG